MRIPYRFGHNELCQGAVGLVNEVIEARRYGGRVIQLLEEVGNKTFNCTPPPMANSGAELTYGTNKENQIEPVGDLFLDFHVNSASALAHGAEMLISTPSQSPKAYAVSNRILQNLNNLGFTNRGVKCTGDNFNDIRESRAEAIIFEPFFLTNPEDVARYKNNFEGFCRAIANGIDSRVALQTPTPVVKGREFNIHMFAHIENRGDVHVNGINDITIGTVGESLRIEAIELDISPDVDVVIDTHVENIGTIKGQVEGQIQGTERQSLRLEGVYIHVRSIPSGYKLMYQAHVENEGWQPWKESGQIAGTEGKSLRMEALRIKIVKC